MSNAVTWSYEVKHGPDGEENYAWVLKGREMVATMRTHLAKEVCAGMNAALSAGQAQPVSIKPLRWKGPDGHGEYHSLDGMWGYIIRAETGEGFWLTEIGRYYPYTEAAKSAAQADYESRIRSALVPPAVPGEVERENAKLVELIKTRFLGVHPDELDCYLEYDDWTRIIAALSTQAVDVKRKRPELLSSEEKKEILLDAEALWRDLQKNNLGGFSDGNRPFYILHAFKSVIEKYGKRDVGLTWSKNDLDALPASPEQGETE